MKKLMTAILSAALVVLPLAVTSTPAAAKTSNSAKPHAKAHAKAGKKAGKHAKKAKSSKQAKAAKAGKNNLPKAKTKIHHAY